MLVIYVCAVFVLYIINKDIVDRDNASILSYQNKALLVSRSVHGDKKHQIYPSTNCNQKSLIIRTNLAEKVVPVL